MSATQQRRQAEAADRQERREAQRAAATKFLGAADLFIAEADSLRYAITSVPEEQIQRVYDRYYDQWAGFLRSRAALAVSTSANIREAGAVLLAAIQQLTNSADWMYRHRRTPTGEIAWSQCYDDAEAARQGFADVVRAELGTLDHGAAAGLTAPRR